MASPSPSSSPPGAPLNSTTSSPPSPSTSSLSPPSSQSNQTAGPPSTPNSSAPPPQSPPASPPPSPPLSPLPSSSPPPPSSPPPSLPKSPPPPSNLASPPPPPSKSPPPPTSPSPPPPASPPTSTPSTPPPPLPQTSPPPPSPSPPLHSTSPPPPPSPDLSPPPPSKSSPPPPSTPNTPPPPENISPSSSPPPPPANVITPPSENSPPEKAPPPPVHHLPPPPPSQSTPLPSNSPPISPLSPDSPPSVPSTSPPPPISPVSPNNSSLQSPTISPLPSVTPEKPTANTSTGIDVTASGSSGNGGLTPGPSVAIAVVVGFLFLSLLVMVVWFVKKRKRRNEVMKIPYTFPSPYTSSQNSDSSFLRSHSPVPLVGSRSGNDFMYSSTEAGGISTSRGFTYEDLAQATNSFSQQNLLGEGGFGCVYKGNLVDGREIAVKQLKIGGGQGEREFRAEVDIISRVHHRHLVSLVGYCISEHQRLLVYDYVPNNTLHYHLHGNSAIPLRWLTRVRIAAGAARGIAYLHEDCHPRIIHRDIKSSNILLDINFDAQVADFGLAKLASDSHTHVTTRVMGTFGYMAPEYATSGKLTDKSDVFSFGVVLLELITGRKPVDGSQPLGDESLVEWARPLLAQALETENFEELVDQKLEKNYIPSEMFRMIEAAAACVRHSAVKRPRMSQVVRALDSLDEMPDLANGVKPGESGVFDSAQHSAQIRMFQRMAFGTQDFSTGYFDRDRSQSQSSRKSGEYDDLSSSTPFNRSRLWNI